MQDSRAVLSCLNFFLRMYIRHLAMRMVAAGERCTLITRMIHTAHCTKVSYIMKGLEKEPGGAHDGPGVSCTSSYIRYIHRHL